MTDLITTNLFYGRQVRLAALRPDDAAVVARWYEDAEFARMYDSSPAYPRPASRISRWFDEADRAHDGYMFAIRPLFSDDIIGVCDVDGIQWAHGSGWMSIAIGEAANRGVGYGSDALRLLLRFAFTEINLHRLQLTVFSYNTRAIRLYEQFGFVREGTLREALRRDGQRWDVYLYALLATEYQPER